jgi:hypothetical protein
MADTRIYEEAIRTKVCSDCIMRTGKGICGSGKWMDCALNEYMAGILRVVTTVRSDSAEEYLQAFRSEVCSECRDIDGKCRLAEGPQCALEDHFPLVIEAVWDVDTRSKN